MVSLSISPRAERESQPEIMDGLPPAIGPTRLSRDVVVDHALAVADTKGPAAVSIRRIAQDLGVTPMALYWHVRNKGELLAAMGDRVLASVALPPRSAGAGLEQLRTLLSALVAALSAHPGSTGPAQMRVLQCESGQELAERALDILRRNGFTPRHSADLTRAALHTAVMLVSTRPGAESAIPRDERALELDRNRAALSGLPVDRFPQLVEAASALTDCDDETAYYQAGVDLFLAGVEALSRR